MVGRLGIGDSVIVAKAWQDEFGLDSVRNDSLVRVLHHSDKADKAEKAIYILLRIQALAASHC